MAYKYTHDRLIIDEVEHGGLVIFKEPFAEVRRLEMDVDEFLEVCRDNQHKENLLCCPSILAPMLYLTSDLTPSQPTSASH